MGRGGQADDKRGALPARVVVTENLASVLLQNAITNAEAETGTFSDLFRGEEGVENLVGMGDSAAVVAERNFDRVSRFGGHDLDARGRPTSWTAS